MRCELAQKCYLLGIAAGFANQMLKPAENFVLDYVRKSQRLWANDFELYSFENNQ